MKRVIPINAAGLRVGEGHHNAKLSDRDVDLIRELYDSGEWGYRKLAAKFEVSRSHIRYLVKCRWRAQAAVAVRVLDED